MSVVATRLAAVKPPARWVASLAAKVMHRAALMGETLFTPLSEPLAPHNAAPFLPLAKAAS